MDDSLATVIPFPARPGRTGTREQPRTADPTGLEDYWALVQRLAAERRRLVVPGAG